jgi:hypothetical protein
MKTIILCVFSLALFVNVTAQDDTTLKPGTPVRQNNGLKFYL